MAVTWDQFRAELEALYRPPIRARKTWRQIRQVVRELAAAGADSPAALTPTLIAAWVEAHPGRSGVTTNSHLRAIRSVVRYARAAGYLDRSPFDFRPATQWVRDSENRAAPPARHLSAEQVRRVLDRADQEAGGGGWVERRLRALVYTLAFTGLRAGEALNLSCDDIRFETSLIEVRPKPTWRPKTAASAAPVGLHDELAAVLRPWVAWNGSAWVFPHRRKTGPWTAGSRGQKPLDEVRALGARAGVAGLTLLSFRKTIGTLAKTWGFGPLELKSLLRHTNIATQAWYDEDDARVTAQVVRKIQFPRPGTGT